MHNTTSPYKATDVITFEALEPELSLYLIRRFSSESFAKRIIQETRKRIGEADILSLVGDARVYLCNFALGIGKQLLQDEYLGQYTQIS